MSITKSMSWEIGERKILKEKRKKELESLKEEFTGVQIREHIDDGYTGTNFVEVG